MLPKNSLRKPRMNLLRVFRGPDHPHKPQLFNSPYRLLHKEKDIPEDILGPGYYAELEVTPLPEGDYPCTINTFRIPKQRDLRKALHSKRWRRRLKMGELYSPSSQAKVRPPKIYDPAFNKRKEELKLMHENAERERAAPKYLEDELTNPYDHLYDANFWEKWLDWTDATRWEDYHKKLKEPPPAPEKKGKKK